MSGELIKAIEAGDSARAIALVRESPECATERDDSGLSALMNALYRGAEDVAAAIREVRADLDVVEAASIGDLERLKALLSTDPALASAWSSDGFTPFTWLLSSVGRTW
jgi:hypothetical protein